MENKNYNQSNLKIIAEELANKILVSKENGNYNLEPFQHIVIDNFLPDNLANDCLNSFPNIESDVWEHSNNEDVEIKLRTKWKSEFDIPDGGILQAIRIFNSSIFLKAMSETLGIEKLMPDPYFSGGGLNATVRGGLLDVHVDGNYHDASGLNRRVNAILYLNPEWESSWGGEFGIYDNTGDNCLKEVAPLFNRLVIFDTHDKSFHGLPNPLNFPEDNPRRSIILYYYTKDARPQNLISVEQPHSALWKKKNWTDKNGNITRDFN
jgi:Rps23 Pro-64 3,4-dihydroxylase Tpa1-like proline 4-hydroxylase